MEKNLLQRCPFQRNVAVIYNYAELVGRHDGRTKEDVPLYLCGWSDSEDIGERKEELDDPGGYVVCVLLFLRSVFYELKYNLI